jgi:hypothetical protein
VTLIQDVRSLDVGDVWTDMQIYFIPRMVHRDLSI